MSLIMDAIAPRPQELLLPSLYNGLIVSKHFDPEALVAEVEEALRFVWPDPEPVHNITETSWALYEPAELLRLIEENERAADERKAAIDNPDLLGFDTKLINGIVYRNTACLNCGNIRLMPADLTLCVPCDAASHLPGLGEPSSIVVFDDDGDGDGDGEWIEIEDDPEEDEPYDEHPVTIQVAADIEPAELAELIIAHPLIEVWRGMVAATNPLTAGERFDKAMTIADRITAP